MSDKKKYRICQKQVSYVSKEVEADNYEEAIRLAKQDEGEWLPEKEYLPKNIDEVIVLNREGGDILVRVVYSTELRKILNNTK